MSKKEQDKEKFIEHVMYLRANRNKEVAQEIARLKLKKESLKKYDGTEIRKELANVNKELRRLKEESAGSNIFKKFMNNIKAKELENAREELKSSKPSKKDLENAGVEIDSEISTLKQELEGKTIRRLLGTLEKGKDVQLVSYKPEAISILTKNIELKGHKIGRYWIRIGDNIRITREDGQTFERENWSGICHPFVVQGKPCFGELADTIETALDTGGFYTVVMASIQLLKCTRAGDGGWFTSPNEFIRALKKREIDD